MATPSVSALLVSCLRSDLYSLQPTAHSSDTFSTFSYPRKALTQCHSFKHHRYTNDPKIQNFRLDTVLELQTYISNYVKVNPCTLFALSTSYLSVNSMTPSSKLTHILTTSQYLPCYTLMQVTIILHLDYFNSLLTGFLFVLLGSLFSIQGSC